MRIKKHRRCRRYFPDALKGRKGEKEIGILNCVWAQSPEERECRRESENSGPQQTFLRLVNGIASFNESKYNTQTRVCQVFCQKKVWCVDFGLFFTGKQTIIYRLNLFVKSTMIRLLNWKTREK